MERAFKWICLVLKPNLLTAIQPLCAELACMNKVKGVKGTAQLSLEVGWRVTFYGREVILGLK